MANKTQEIIENTIIYAGLFGEIISKNIKEANDIVGTEITIKKLQAEKAKKTYELGKDVFETKQINEILLAEINEIEKQICILNKKGEK